MRPQLVKPPETVYPNDQPLIFLAGTIDGGASVDWQTEAWEGGLKYNYFTVFNPRRDDWDDSWHHSSKVFDEQVTWELDCLDDSDVVAFNILKDSKSPITLMELGLMAHHHAAGVKRVIVRCEPGFWREGNVRIVCQRYGIPMYDDWDTWMYHVVRAGHRVDRDIACTR